MLVPMDRSASLNTALEHVHDALRSNDHTRALSITAELLAAYPEAVRVWRARASTLEAAGQFEAAAEAYNRVLDIMPSDAAAMSGYARSLSAAGRALEAGEAARQALDYEWDSERMRQITRAEFKATTGRIALARGQFQAGMHNRAFNKLRGLLEQQPSRADAHVVLAELLWHAGARHVAAEVCDTILASHPNSLSVHAMLMSLARRRGDAATERHHATILTRVDPDHRETYGLLGEQSSLRVTDVPAVIGVPGYLATEDADTRSDWVDGLIASTSAAPLPATRPPAAEPEQTGAQTPEAGTATAPDDIDEPDTEVSIVTYGSAVRDDDFDDLGDIDTAPPKTQAEELIGTADLVSDSLVEEAASAPVAERDEREATAALELPPLDWSSVDGDDATGNFDDVQGPSDSEIVGADELPPARAVRAAGPRTTDEGVVIEPLDWAQTEDDDDDDVMGEASDDSVVFGVERGRANDNTHAAQGTTASAPLAPATAEPHGPHAARGGKNKPDALLQSARAAIDTGDIETASAKYEQLVTKGKLVDAVVDDLETATLSFPSAKRLYEVLGQAHTRRGNIPAALDAYRRALESVDE